MQRGRGGRRGRGQTGRRGRGRSQYITTIPTEENPFTYHLSSSSSSSSGTLRGGRGRRERRGRRRGRGRAKEGKYNGEHESDRAFVIHVTDSSESESSKQIFHNQKKSKKSGSEVFECKDKGKKDEEGKREQAFVVHMTDSSESESSKQVFHNQQNSEKGGSEFFKYEGEKDFVYHLKSSSESESKQGSHKSKKRKAADDDEELDDDILKCGLKVKNLSLEDISKIFKENFNAFEKVENWRHEKYKSFEVCKKDKQLLQRSRPSYPYTDQQLQHVDHLVNNKFLKDIPASTEYLSGLNREYTNAHKYNEDVRKPYIMVKIYQLTNNISMETAEKFILDKINVKYFDEDFSDDQHFIV